MHPDASGYPERTRLPVPCETDLDFELLREACGDDGEVLGTRVFCES